MSEYKYCSSCLSFKLAKNGKVVQTASKSVKRFKCALCLSRMIKPKKDNYVSRTY